MKKIHITIILLLASILFFSCKKKDSPPPAANNNSTSNTTGGIGASNATSFYGILTFGYYTSIFSQTTYTSILARAYFSNQPTPYINQSSAVTINNVSLEGDSMIYSPVYGYYTSYTNFAPTAKAWSVMGANSIPSFSYVCTVSQPTCAAVILPDSVSKSSAFTITVNNITSAVHAYFLMSDASHTVTYSAPLSNGNNNIVITPANMQALATGTGGNIAVVLDNNSAINVSGKDFQFVKEMQINKQLKINP